MPDKGSGDVNMLANQQGDSKFLYWGQLEFKATGLIRQ